MTLTANTAVVTVGANSGTTDTATNPTKGTTANQDIINANLNLGTSFIQDLTTGDADVLNAILGAASTATVIGVETLNLTGAGGSLDLSKVTGATAINLVSGAQTLINVAATSPVNVNSGFAGAAVLTHANAGGGTADFAVTLNGGSATGSLQFEDSANAQLTGVTDLVTLTVASTSSLDKLWDDNAAAAATGGLLVKGSGNLTVADLQFASTVADSTYTGTLDLTIKAASAHATQTVTGGAGNDVFNFTTTYANGDVIDGGAGSDTLKVADTAAVNLGSVTNVEKVVATGSTATTVTTAAGNLGLGETLTIDGSALTAKLTTAGGATAIYKLNITGSSTVGNELVGGQQADNIIGGTGADTIQGGAGIDTINLGVDTVVDVVQLTSAATADRDVITNFDVARDVISIDESAFATIDFANTGAVAALAAGDYNEIAAAGTISADKVNVITTAAGYASYTAAMAAVTGAANGNEAFVIFYNSTSGKTEMYWDADADDGDSGVLIAQIDITGTNVALLSEVNFSVF